MLLSRVFLLGWWRDLFVLIDMYLILLCRLCTCGDEASALYKPCAGHVCHALCSMCTCRQNVVSTLNTFVLQNVPRCGQKAILCNKQAAKSDLYKNEKQRVSWMHILDVWQLRQQPLTQHSSTNTVRRSTRLITKYTTSCTILHLLLQNWRKSMVRIVFPTSRTSYVVRQITCSNLQGFENHGLPGTIRYGHTGFVFKLPNDRFFAVYLTDSWILNWKIST